MRIVAVPPYQNPNINWVFILKAILANIKRKGRLEGVEVDFDDGYFTPSTSESRDEESRAIMSAGLISKVKEYSQKNEHQAIVFTGGSDPGFAAARLASGLPLAASLHSCLVVASEIGERCGQINLTASSALTVRHAAESYGYGHKLAAIRYVNYSTSYIYRILLKYKDNWDKRFTDPDLQTVINDIVEQCKALIVKDRVDSIIITVEPIQALEDQIRLLLDASGLDEIPLICGFEAALQMARVMADMKLIQAPRAYPGPNLRSKPEHY